MSLRSMVILFLGVGLMGCTASEPEGEPGDTPQATTLLAEPGVTLSPTIPTDLPADPTHDDAVAFAWQSFVAVNWPALEGQRGEPDSSKTIGDAGITVRDTWKRSEEIFLPDGSAPVGWSAWGESTPSACGGVGSGSLVLSRTSKVPPGPEHPVFGSVLEAAGGTLTDQNGHLARFDITVNRTEFEYIVDNTLYSVEGQAEAGAIDFSDGSIETKAAWRVIDGNEDPSIRGRYHTVDAWLYDAPENGPVTCEQTVVGLVGLHIAQKTPSRPEWIWATFEHVDNVPPFGTESGGPYSFNDPSCSAAECPPNQETPEGTPTQVTRMIAVGAEAAAANPTWQQALAGAVSGSVWQYYQLVDVQWPTDPERPPFGSPRPMNLANTTMETFVPSSSCMGCHSSATKVRGVDLADFSYLLGEAKSASGGTR